MDCSLDSEHNTPSFKQISSVITKRCFKKMSKFLHDEDDANAMAMPQVFSENSRAKKENFSFLTFILRSEMKLSSCNKSENFAFSNNILKISPNWTV